ncbi:hypothetical protein FOMG_19248 [Fusarium oxysporum f. sp. melonis 26406]|uniref:Uncharacterized protein n=1 Tax=Fusarium oxysporum f. sp. melonis 26406 TaxID=1089452 RepID=W9ZSF8_FUSOX|nr:hypothetical protein FOMG_19248 [Fusarium oxysporum f. sp. melonis 26406]
MFVFTVRILHGRIECLATLYTMRKRLTEPLYEQARLQMILHLVHLPRVFRLALSIRISSLFLHRLLSAPVLISKPILRQLWGF